MEVRKGYKRTEVGVIPEEWEVVSLERMCELIGDGTHQTPNYVDSGINFLSVENVTSGEFEKTKFITQEAYDKYAHYSKTKVGDILITRIGTLGKTAMVKWSYPSSIYVSLALLRINEDALRNWVYAYSKSDFFIASIESRSLMRAIPQKINLGELGKVLIPLPPTKAEQRAIATALSEADAYVAALEALIAKKRQVKQGVMKEVLTPGEGWREVPLGEIITIRHGKSQHDVKEEYGRYPILASGGVIGRSSKFLYDKPSVLIGRKGTIDVPRFSDTPFWSVDTLFYSEIHGSNSPRFIYYLFNIINWYDYNESSGVPSLNAKTIERITVFIPPTVIEQTRIANLLTDLDEDLTALEAQLAKARAVKTGMLADLLTGRVRLV